MARISPNFVANETIIVVGAPRCTGHAHVCRDWGLRSNYILMSTLLKLAGSPRQAVGHLRQSTCGFDPIGRILSCNTFILRSEPARIVSRTRLTCSDDAPHHETSEKLRSENGPTFGDFAVRIMEADATAALDQSRSGRKPPPSNGGWSGQGSCLIGDHPPESLPHVLHALGRVLPLAAAKGEFTYAITFAPGSKR
jgi:hypothetical protein